MASLTSAGTLVTITDDSLFIPSNASTVPLIFLATAAEKNRADGVTPAAGTFEHSTVRTVTSIKQSLDTYGIPRFITDSAGNPFHGDCRNEYGLVALNQYLGIGNKVFTVRANVNLNDDIGDLRTSWSAKQAAAGLALQGLIASFISYTNANAVVGTPAKVSVTATELKTLAREATAGIWTSYSFASSRDLFLLTHASAPYATYANGYSANSTSTFIGLDGEIDAFVAASSGSTVSDPTTFTGLEARTLLVAAAEGFKFTREFRDATTLGANDAARRAKIVTALQAALNSNTDLRSENYEYNIILCPGYPEVVDDMIALNVDIKEEAFVIGDTPMNLDPETLVNTWSVSVEKRTSNKLAYYYPSVLTTNVDGNDVLVPASAVVLRQYGITDTNFGIHQAPAGVDSRGLISTAADVGYVSGTLGTPTTFVQAYLNNGQRDDLYKDFTNINPITFFPNRGIVVFGQKTSANVNSDLDRVNVSRELGKIKRALRKNTLGFVFRLNNDRTRSDLKAAVDNYLSNELLLGAIEDYATLCDLSNNTPIRRQSHELYIDCAIKFALIAEFLIIPIRIVAAGADL